MFMSTFRKRFAAYILLSICAGQGVGAELRIAVRLPDGGPAEGIPVYYEDLNPWSEESRSLGTTDAHGQLWMYIDLKPRGPQENESINFVKAYRIVLMPKDFRWEISDIFWGRFQEWQEVHEPGWLANMEENNMSVGNVTKISQDTVTEWDVTLSRGPTRRIVFVDQNGEAIRNRSVGITLCLSPNVGMRQGNLKIADACTDNDGKITIHHAGTFFYSFNLPDQLIYVTPGISYHSAVVTKKIEQENEKIVYHKCATRLEVVVRDKVTGKPISGAQVIQLMLFDRILQGGPIEQGILTDDEGRFSTNLFCLDRSIEVGASKDGYETFTLPVTEIVPGTIQEFLLEPEPR